MDPMETLVGCPEPDALDVEPLPAVLVLVADLQRIVNNAREYLGGGVDVYESGGPLHFLDTTVSLIEAALREAERVERCR